jgi:hypothetical protein
MEVVGQTGMVVARDVHGKCPLHDSCSHCADLGPALSDLLPWTMNQASGIH